MRSRFRVIVMALLFCGGCVWRIPSQVDRHQAKVLIDQGVTFMRHGDFESARAAFSLSQEIEKSAAAADGLGCVALMRGKLRRAEQYFVRALEMDSDYSEVLGNLALLNERRGNTIEAERFYRIALEKDPANYRIRNNFAVFLYARSLAHAYPGARVSGKTRIKHEFLKAGMVTQSPIVEGNISKF